MLQRILVPLDPSAVTMRTQVVVGDPAAVILDLAAMLELDLICMTTHGYSSVTRWMLGAPPKECCGQRRAR